MRGAVIYAPGDVRVQQHEDPKIGSFFASDGTCETCQAGYQMDERRAIKSLLYP